MRHAALSRMVEISLRSLCVLCASAAEENEKLVNRRGAENAELNKSAT